MNEWTVKFPVYPPIYSEEELFVKLLHLYRKHQDEIDRYIIYNFFYYNRPRGLAKVDAWWDNTTRKVDEFVKFRSKIEKDFNLIRNPYRYDYGHYFVKEKYYEK